MKIPCKNPFKSIFAFALITLFFASVLPRSIQAIPDRSDKDRSLLLLPVKTDTPRDTMKTFVQAMEDYRRGIEKRDPELQRRIQDATRTLNLEAIPYVVQEEKGQMAAIYLKEVMDRIIQIDYEKIPDSRTLENGETLHRWRLKDTEIIISLVPEGERAGEYLFSPATVLRSKEFYEKVKHLDYVIPNGGALYQKSFMETLIPQWGHQPYLGLKLWQWIGLLIAILIGLIVRTIIRFFGIMILKVTHRLQAHKAHTFADIVHGPADLLGATGVWYILLGALNLEGNALAILSIALQVLLYGSLIWLAYRITGNLSSFLYKAAAKTQSTLDDQLVPLLNRTIKIFTIVLGTLVAIQNMGVNVLSLLAGLGIGGIAFALAAKDTVANFFGSIMILFDSPFQVGDWIKIGDMEGTVEEIGFRSTRIRTFYNSLVSVPNSDLMNARIDNMGRREYRRILAYLGVKYDTPPEKLQSFIDGIKQIVMDSPTTRKDYFHVVFNEYSDSSLTIMLYCFLKVPDWSTELLERQKIYMEILYLASRLGVSFAFPTQSLHIESLPASPDESLPGKG